MYYKKDGFNWLKEKIILKDNNILICLLTNINKVKNVFKY